MNWIIGVRPTVEARMSLVAFILAILWGLEFGVWNLEFGVGDAMS